MSDPKQYRYSLYNTSSTIAQNDAEVIVQKGYDYISKQDYVNARLCFEKAAEQNSAEAQYCVGVIYDNGFGVIKDYSKALLWYEKAAKQNFAEAQCNIGVIYENGYGVTRDYHKAVFWYKKAAENGNILAQTGLGACYANGYGIEQDYGCPVCRRQLLS